MFIAEWEKIISGQKLKMTFPDNSSLSSLPLLLLDKSLLFHG